MSFGLIGFLVVLTGQPQAPLDSVHTPATYLREACLATDLDGAALIEVARSRDWTEVPVTSPDGSAIKGAVGYAASDASITLIAPQPGSPAGPVCTVTYSRAVGDNWQDEMDALATEHGFSPPLSLPSSSGGATTVWIRDDGRNLAASLTDGRLTLLLAQTLGTR